MAITNELKETIKLMQSGNEEAFAHFYQTTHSYVYAKAKYIMHNEEDALDLTQETFIQAYKGIGGIADVDNVYAWLGGIVYRQGMKIFNRKKELLVGEEQEYVFEEIVSEDATPEQALEMQATANIVQGMIEELPELQRIAIIAFYYDNMKIDDIATECECSPNTIKSRLKYAKNFLKEKVETHQKQNNYKLCSISPALLLYVFKEMFKKESYQMSSQAANAVYTSVCGELGVKAVSLSATGAAGVAGTAGTAGATGAVAAGATVTAIGTGLGIKIAAIAGAVLIGGAGIGFGGYQVAKHLSKSDAGTTSETIVSENVYETIIDEETSSDFTTENTSESALEIPTGEQTEFIGNFSNLEINISDEREFYDAGNGHVDMQIVMNDDAGNETDSVFQQEVQFIDGKASIDMLSNQNVRYFGDIYRFEDGSMMAYLSVDDPEFGVYDVAGTYSVPVFMTKEKNDEIQNNGFSVSKYMGNGCDVEITNIDGEFMDAKFSVRTKDANTFVANTEGDYPIANDGGIVTFNMTTSAGTLMRGYMYLNSEGKLVFNYLEYDGEELKSYSSHGYQLIQR